jgi:dihydroneopterin aldolase
MPIDDSSDAISIEDLELMALVGVPDDERAIAQRISVSLRLWPVNNFRGLEDQLARTVNYAAVCREVKDVVARRSDKLIETLAEAIASDLLATFPLARVRIELRKFILPDVKHVSVILTRGAAQPNG